MTLRKRALARPSPRSRAFTSITLCGILLSMIHPVYNIELQPERLDSYYYEMLESDLAPRGLKEHGHIDLGPELPEGEDVYRLGEMPKDKKVLHSLGIVAVYHVMLVGYEAEAEQGKLSAEKRPYDEEPVSIRAIGLNKEGARFSLAGIYYPSNEIQGWVNISPREY